MSLEKRIELLLREGVSLRVIQNIIRREFTGLNGETSAKAIRDEFARINPGETGDFSGLDLSTTDTVSPHGDRGISDFGYRYPPGWTPRTFPTYRGTPEDRAPVTAVPEPAGDFQGQTISPEFTQREIASRTRRGRGDIWSSFLENMPGSRNFSNLLQRGYQEAFDPLSAQFALQSNIPGPAGGYGPLDFRNFLQAGPQKFTQQDWLETLGPLRMAFGDDPPQTSLGLRDRFEDVAMQNNLMAQIMGGNIADRKSVV